MLFDLTLDRKGWYRIQGRETISYPATLKPGTTIKTARIIIRAGYEYEALDMPQIEEDQILVNRLCAAASLTDEQLDNVLKFSYQGYGASHMQAIPGNLDRFAFRYERRQIRQEWLDAKPQPRIRTLWYIDHSDSDWKIAYVIDKIVRRKIGQYLPGYAGGSGIYPYEEEAYYEPATLDEWCTQPLYYIDRAWNFNTRQYIKVYVHPLDAVEN